MGFEVCKNAFFTVDYGIFLRQTYRPFYISGSYIVLSNRPRCNFHYTCRHTRSPSFTVCWKHDAFLRMGTRQHEEYLRLYKTYGDIFRLYLGNVCSSQYVDMNIFVTLLWGRELYWATVQRGYFTLGPGMKSQLMTFLTHKHLIQMQHVVLHTFDKSSWFFLILYK